MVDIVQRVFNRTTNCDDGTADDKDCSHTSPHGAFIYAMARLSAARIE